MITSTQGKEPGPFVCAWSYPDSKQSRMCNNPDVLSEQRVLVRTPLAWLFSLCCPPAFLFGEAASSPSWQDGVMATWCREERPVLNGSVPERLPRWCILVNKVLVTLSNGHMNTEESNQRQWITCFLYFTLL